MIQNKSPYKDYGDSDLTDDYLFLEDEFEKGKEPSFIPNELYDKYNVKKGLRNNNGTGVLVLLTKISEVHGYNIDNDGNKIDDQGHLYYRGYDIYDLAKLNKEAFGFERVMFLILFCHLPSEEELEKFHAFISDSYSLPYEFAENFILKTPSRSTMNTIQRAILSLYSYDDNPDSIDTFETLKKGLSIIAKMPAIIAYSYQAKKHYIDGKSLFIHKPKKEYTMAQNILYMTRSDGKFTTLEAETLDLALIIHADHGGGNNSTFANIVISSTGTDIYSSMSGSLGSLKGPRHGGANKEVRNMMKQVIHSIGLKASEEDLEFLGMSPEELKNRYMKEKSILFVSRSSNGSDVYIGNEHYSVPSKKIDVLDSTGAGDAFFARILLELDHCSDPYSLSIENWKEILMKANEDGANACLHKGALK